MQNSDQLKEVELIHEAPLNGPEDIADETRSQLTEFHGILEEIKKRPDAELKIAQIMETLRSLAGKSSEFDDETEEDDDEIEEDDETSLDKRHNQFAEYLIDTIFPYDISEKAASALFYIIELAIFNDMAGTDIAEALRRHLFLRTHVADKIIHQLAGKAKRNFLKKAA